MEETFEPKVSVIIPVYNGSNYLKEAIDSVVGQTYKNIEILVINDGSNDNGATEAIALSYGDQIRYFKKENGGVATALNCGLFNMSGDYFSWLSHDDIYYPDKIWSQIQVLSKCIEKNTIIYGGYELINYSSKTIGYVRPQLQYSPSRLNIPLFPIIRGLINGCTLLVHRDHFCRVGFFDETLKTTQDYALWFKMFRGAEIAFHNEILVKTRIHDDRGTFKIPNHLEECDNLWINFLHSITPEESLAIEDSRFLFFKKTAEFLATTPYTKAKEHAEIKAREVLDGTLVSIIIPFYNRVELTINAIDSATNQTHTNLEIIVLDDGSNENVSNIEKRCCNDRRIKYFKLEHKGPGASRNFGIIQSSGDYIAFLDSDDTFDPNKIKIQLLEMENGNHLFSHTSYRRHFLLNGSLEEVSSGSFSGNVFPSIVTSCRIATPTVMLKREILSNYKFREDIFIGEDVCLWIDILSKHNLLGIDFVLTTVTVGENTCAFNNYKQMIGLSNIVSHVLLNKDRYSVNIYGSLRPLINFLGAMVEAEDSCLKEHAHSIELLENGHGPPCLSTSGTDPVGFRAIETNSRELGIIEKASIFKNRAITLIKTEGFSTTLYRGFRRLKQNDWRL